MYGLLEFDGDEVTFVDASENRQALKDIAKIFADNDVIVSQQCEDPDDPTGLIFRAKETEDGWDVVYTYRDTLEESSHPCVSYKIVKSKCVRLA